MLRLSFAAILVFGACAEANACTLLPSLYAPGSPAAIAEEVQSKKQLAAGIAASQLVFVGRTVGERLPEISEITAGLIGRWDETPGVRSWFEPVRVLKGKADLPTTNIFSGLYGSTCGYGPSLKIGEQVIVYARRQGGYWFGETTSLDLLPYLEPLLR